MASTQTIILECGVDCTRLAVFSRRRTRLSLEYYAAEPFAPGKTSEGDWLEQTGAAILRLRGSLKARGGVVLVLPAHLTLTKFFKTPRVDAASRDKIILFEAQENLPYPLLEVAWDSVVVDETDAECELLLGAAKLEVLTPLCAAARAAGFVVSHLLPAPLATLAGLKLAREDATESTLVLNLGSRTATLLLAEAGRFAVRNFAVGPDRALAGELPPLVAGPASTNEEKPGVRLVQEVARTLLHFQWKTGLGKPRHLYLTGPGPLPHGLSEQLEKRFGVPAHLLNVFSAIDVARTVSASFSREAAIGLTDLIGAAATQLADGHVRLNLLLPGERKDRVQSRRQAALFLVAGLAAAVPVAPLFYFHALKDELRMKIEAVERELVPWRERAARQRLKLEEVEARVRDIEKLDGAFAKRTSWLEFLADLEQRLGQSEDVWLDRLRVEPLKPGLPLKLTLSGRILERENAAQMTTAATAERLHALFATIAESPYVAAIEGQRFNRTSAGILQFDFVVVGNLQKPL